MPSSIQQTHFLYVEDDAFSRDIMEVLVKEVLGSPHLTVWADSEQFKPKVAALNPVPDIIFLDIHIQPLSGFAMLNVLKADTRFAQARIVALTASVMSTEVEEIQNAGFDGLLGKPLNQMAFPEIVDKLLKGETVWDDQWD